VLDAAERIFAAGYARASVKSIADDCEIAVGTIYKLFTDKENLFKAVLLRRGAVLQELAVATVSEPLPGDEALTALARAHIRFFREHADWARIATAVMSPGSRREIPGIGAELYDLGHRLAVDLQTEVITRGQREGLVRLGDPTALAKIFSAMVAAFHAVDDGADRTAPERPYDLDEFLDLLRAAFAVPRSPS
jgi:AcrR family transcriptional regulator